MRQEFHALSQGDLPVAAYCGELKFLADKLRDLGSPMPDHDLVVGLLNGLNDKFAHCVSTISAFPAADDLSPGAVLPPPGGDLHHQPGEEGGVHRVGCAVQPLRGTEDGTRKRMGDHDVVADLDAEHG